MPKPIEPQYYVEGPERRSVAGTSEFSASVFGRDRGGVAVLLIHGTERELVRIAAGAVAQALNKASGS
jgi:hypothetical protein